MLHNLSQNYLIHSFTDEYLPGYTAFVYLQSVTNCLSLELNLQFQSDTNIIWDYLDGHKLPGLCSINWLLALPATRGLLLCWRDVITMSIWALSTLSGRQNTFHNCIIFKISNFIWLQLPGATFSKCQHSSKPWTLPAISFTLLCVKINEKKKKKQQLIKFIKWDYVTFIHQKQKFK